MQIKSLLKSLCPPIVVDAVAGVQSRNRPDPGVIEIDNALFRSAVGSATAYGEYGMGLSTRFVAEQSDIPIVSVDTSSSWVATTREAIGDRESTYLIHIDVGAVGEWGRPLSYEHMDRFVDYLTAPFSTKAQPDLVLVDGRMRVACFLTALLESEAGTNVIFDDYPNRPQYHIVEQVVRPTERCGRQALFVVPDEIDIDLARRLRGAFVAVLD